MLLSNKVERIQIASWGELVVLRGEMGNPRANLNGSRLIGENSFLNDKLALMSVYHFRFSRGAYKLLSRRALGVGLKTGPGISRDLSDKQRITMPSRVRAWSSSVPGVLAA